MARLTVHALEKRFANTAAVDRVSLDVEDGELICLLGPSGSGKSTMLRMIGGFERPTGGQILIDGQDVTHLPPERRPTGMVFQSHALWTHMTVAGNIAFGLKLRHLPRAEVRDKVEWALSLVGLAGYGSRMPYQLSGGQQQRVALARSLVLEPKILLLDEPFASLDQHLRERLREEVRDIQQRLGITTLFVTHGQDEALAISDRIAVLKDGRIEQLDTPDRVYRRPQTQFTAGFIGTMGFIEAEVRDGRFQHPDLCLPLTVSDGPATLALRPEDIVLAPATGPEGPVVVRAVDFGSHHQVELQLSEGERIKAMTEASSRWQRGDRVRLSIRNHALFRDGKVVLSSADTPDVELKKDLIHG
ncbi:ABC transporter ATP-binding protein [Rhizobium paknamense]|uniref:Spermidine/putrescine transport system ATP-binding protein n=1 Tax=Rhizobium paknamense TaxID=1206817 RepID=A0ABU0IB49_9HYPH|nr:ABC transporter ATP-binding protein [Rhizobium paknamense]MDQ0455446.1 putative spermidine/putrescine transport system ATP-binding protein [Rhizobium paknamense]